MIDVATLAAALALVKASGGGGSGEPGFSPTVEIAEVEGGTQVTITDVNGPQTFTVLNGTNGTNGVNGQDGQDGVSPVLSIGEVTTLAAGSQATASLGGTAANPTLNLGIPQGAQGAQGAPGLDAPQIDDTQITTTNPWSSMKIVNTVCPAFTVSGLAVQCTPVANSPLGVQVEITPTQEGTGDPSPENVRPIVGWDTVNVTRCGKNLLDISNMQTITKKGVTFQLENGGIHVSGTATDNVDSPIFEMFLPSGTYINNMKAANFSWLFGSSFVVQRPDGTNYYYVANQPFTINEDEKSLYWYFGVKNGATLDEIVYPQLELGSTTTAYEPYTGTTATLTLPETIYGGTVDAVTGAGEKTWEFVEFDGTENWNITNSSTTTTTNFNTQATAERIPDSGTSETTQVCNVAAWKTFNWSGDYPWTVSGSQYSGNIFISVPNEIASTAEQWKSYLATQASAGTPVQVAYKLATPEPFQATGNQTIPALPGTNTVYTDAGNTTVTGASDPIATITALQNRVSALESAALN